LSALLQHMQRQLADQTQARRTQARQRQRQQQRERAQRQRFATRQARQAAKGLARAARCPPAQSLQDLKNAHDG
jgi:hypothetical protein